MPGPSIAQTVKLVVLSGGPLRFLKECQRRYGKAFRLPTGGAGTVFFGQTPDIKAWLGQTNGHRYVRGDYFEAIRRTSGDNIVTVDGDPWRRTRQAIAPAFSNRSLDQLVPLARESLDNSLREWDRWCDSGELVDLERELPRLTLTFLRDVMFSASSESFQINEMTELLSRQMKWVIGSILTYWAPEWVPRPGSRLGVPARARLFEISHAIVSERRSGADPRPDLLSRLLELRYEDTGEPLSDEAIVNELGALIVGGYDTTSLALEWTIALLAQNPGAAAKLRAEADAYDGNFDSMAELDRMKFAGAAFLEAQRIQAMPILSFVSTQDEHIGGFHVAKGAQLAVCPYLVHYDPDIWKRPDEFIPERFLDGGHVQGPSYKFLAFGAGPHVCIGWRMAMLEGQFALIKIAQRYDIEVAPDYRIDHKFGHLLGLKQPLKVRLRRRVGTDERPIRAGVAQ